MTALTQGYRSLSFLVGINWDRLLFPLGVLAGLAVGAGIGGYLV
ncbi:MULTISPECIES: hypothetical protein [Donghicola]|jgi:hypothetical protein|uniref:Putative RIP metalloprotease RseP n=1 Tax=Donghicola eburneus TaxID=393278 RepID=A0A1M4N0H1_9RHOB|nr:MULTISPECIES: hypothetical protein [Donghicola]MCT4577367.1 hypothetical protein [Donghicola sp.]SCM68301.1 putative RIP metalloprotease RseP [Donghicola eburneus]SFQ21393.1 hypothetical protein SAMN05421764_102129 [Donghicola eburneus]